MTRATRQRVTGLTINEHLNLGRAEYDALKAMLHNCRSRGPDGENREGRPNFRHYLEGRVAWVEQVNSQRGTKLRVMFDAINWS